MRMVRLESFGGVISHGVRATQSAAVPTERKRHRASPKKNEEQQAQDLDTQATQPPTSELVVALKALP